MGHLVVACSMLIAAAASEAEASPAPSPADLSAYREESARAGRDPAAQVRLALWCEAHGLRAERVRHLALAVLADPRNAAARGLMGLVADGGRWRKPEAVSERARADADRAEALAEYNARRDKARDHADAQWKLALWCDEVGLKAEALAHFTAVTRLDPKREAAWQRLGCKKHNGRWMTDEQITAEHAEIQAQGKADRRWKPQLERWKAALGSPVTAKKAEALRELAAVTDPRAVSSVWRVFVGGKAPDQALAAQLLGQIDAPAATQGLAMLSVAGDSPEVLQAAIETLRRRDPRDFFAQLIGLLRDPLKYKIKPVDGPGSTGILVIEGENTFLRRDYTLPLAARIPNFVPFPISYDPTYGGVAVGTTSVVPDNGPAIGDLARKMQAHPGQAVDLIDQAARANGGNGHGSFLPDLDFQIALQIQAARVIWTNQQMAAIQQSTVMARQQMLGDVAAVERTNKVIGEDNDRVVAVLNAVIGQEPPKGLGKAREAWKAWWLDQQGYVPSPKRKKKKPTITEPIGLDEVVTYSDTVPAGLLPRHSCFGAGTTVRTLDGPRPVEAIRVGDRLLTQDTTTGALAFRPAVAIYHNPPSATLRIDLGGEAVVATGIHRFWIVGKGWVMARDLKPGDSVRALGGTSRVVSIMPDEVQPVFNLEVSGGDFFVGKPGALVHDNSLVQPVLSPFDARSTPDDSTR